jgi:hypothetical protein
MADEALRAAELRWTKTGQASDLIGLIKARVREGPLPQVFTDLLKLPRVEQVRACARALELASAPAETGEAGALLSRVKADLADWVAGKGRGTTTLGWNRQATAISRELANQLGEQEADETGPDDGVYHFMIREEDLAAHARLRAALHAVELTTVDATTSDGHLEGALRWAEVAAAQHEPNDGALLVVRRHRDQFERVASTRVRPEDPTTLRPFLARVIDQLPTVWKKTGGTCDIVSQQRAFAYPFAERAPTGRAACLECGKAIAQDTVRVVIPRVVDRDRFQATRQAFLHPACAAEFIVDVEDLAGALARNSDALSPDERAALLAAVAREATPGTKKKAGAKKKASTKKKAGAKKKAGTKKMASAKKKASAR